MLKPIIGTLAALSLVACGGGGGSDTSPTPKLAITPIAVPHTESGCTLKTYSNEYPAEYVKTKVPFPTSTLDPSVFRMIGLKDYHPNFKNDCVNKTEYSRLLYSTTLDRIKSIGTDVVEIYQYGPVDDFNNPVWTFKDSNLQIPPAELEWVVGEAHSKGLKVTLAWQLWPIDSKGNIINTTNPSSTEVIKLLHGWKDIITNLASIADKIKIDNLFIQWHALYYPAVLYNSEIATQEFLSIISDIRKIYSGKLFMGTPRFFDQRIIEKIDAVVIPLFPTNWTPLDNINLTKEKFLLSIYNQYYDFTLGAGVSTISTPIIWDIGIQSRENSLIDLWVEDSFCVSSVNGNLGGPIVEWNAPNCMQINYVTDFGIQAVATEGAFQAIKEQTFFKTYGVKFGSNYWYTDTLVPSAEGFPNLSQSIRGKPAESIVKYWFSRS